MRTETESACWSSTTRPSAGRRSRMLEHDLRWSRSSAWPATAKRPSAEDASSSRAGPDHLGPRDAADGRLHVPAARDGQRKPTPVMVISGRSGEDVFQGVGARRRRLHREADSSRATPELDDHRAGTDPQGACDTTSSASTRSESRSRRLLRVARGSHESVRAGRTAPLWSPWDRRRAALPH